ncbi:MAG: PilW family protein [Candidatus Methylomirabilales bacterium]
MSGAGPGRPARRAGEPAGVTLIEAVIAMALMGIVTTAMYAFFLATNASYADQAVVSRTLWTANDAMRRIADDIRRAGITAGLAPACSALLPMVVSATNASGGSITIRLVLDDPARRTELDSDQSQTAPTLRVVTTAGWQREDIGFLTDGAQCTRFTVTAPPGGTPPGLTHVPANDTNSSGGAGYTYRAGSLVYRQLLDERVTYAIDTTDPDTWWLTRDTGTGPRRLIPDVQSIGFSYILASGATVTDPSTITTVAAAGTIRRVNIAVTVQADTRSRAGSLAFRTQTLTSSVKLRNLGS